eukprot:CAMPEP_0176346796 /NCGR_PEP_ID=MMETSP0126-20121128/6514_1 /TAXON_ID=141414 ORGANISM="Strombidinopsis acuminatum, Strain SPMC142" /NCGR_SAMPLE_ID=MMETSP0126 /ASSEMBLY_ACC=CAM_ASM_000229 /LENGTH=75 /DNA_ID=CAMNT_0017694527 /DNA_START=218 /DNA_END=445 /DNA_ORIENTATION=-
MTGDEQSQANGGMGGNPFGGGGQGFAGFEQNFGGAAGQQGFGDIFDEFEKMFGGGPQGGKRGSQRAAQQGKGQDI